MAFMLTGCKTDHAVVAVTGTALGVEIAQNPANQMYHAKLGYARSEVAYVPSNRAKGTNAFFGEGAKDVADVLLELRMINIFKGGGVYQRLAVGSTAVTQPGASLMFAKSVDGTLDPKVAEALTKNLETIPVPDESATSAKVPLAMAYEAAPDKTAWNEAARAGGYTDFSGFLKADCTLEDVQKMKKSLTTAGAL